MYDKYAIFMDLTRKYAQEDPSQTPAVDPDEVSIGQSVYDSSGKEFVVVEDDPGTTNKVLMPKQQTTTTTGVPEGVQTVENAELQSQYSLRPEGGQAATTASKCAIVRVLPEFLED